MKPYGIVSAAMFVLVLLLTWAYAYGAENCPEQSFGFEVYTFGVVMADGSCSVREHAAQNRVKAYEAARSLCRDCEIEDITNRSYKGEAPWDTVPLKEVYCTMRR